LELWLVESSSLNLLSLAMRKHSLAPSRAEQRIFRSSDRYAEGKNVWLERMALLKVYIFDFGKFLFCRCSLLWLLGSVEVYRKIPLFMEFFFLVCWNFLWLFWWLCGCVPESSALKLLWVETARFG